MSFRKLFSITSMVIFLQFSLQAQTQKVPSFDAIHASGNVEVLLQKSNDQSIDIEVMGISQDKVIADVQGGILKVRIKNTIYNKKKSARVVVNYNELREVKAQAGARIYSKTAVSGDKLELRAASGAQISLEIWTDVLEARAAEGGEIEVTGETASLSATAATGGLFYGDGLKAQNVYAKSHTGGEIEVYANKRIEARAGTGGNISFRGNPTHKDLSTNLGGTVDGH